MSLDHRLRQMLETEQRIADAAQRFEDAALKAGGGGGTSGGVTDDWKKSVDAQLGNLHADVRRLTGYIVASIAAPFVALAVFYVAFGGRFDAVSTKFDGVEVRIVGVENKVNLTAVEQAKTNGKLDILLERTKPTSR